MKKLKPGAKKKPEEEIKKRVPCWVQQKHITKVGSMEKATEIAEEAIINYKPPRKK